MKHALTDYDRAKALDARRKKPAEPTRTYTRRVKCWVYDRLRAAADARVAALLEDFARQEAERES
jgi:hypothetical protein